MANSAWLRTIVGFLVAPISPGLLAVILAAPFRAGIAAFNLREFAEAAWILKLSGLIGYPIAIFLGVPLYVFFRSRGWNALLIYIAAGALLGLVVYLIYVLFAEYTSNGLLGLSEKFSNTAQIYMPLATVCGAAAALVFWLIARPDRISLMSH